MLLNDNFIKCGSRLSLVCSEEYMSMYTASCTILQEDEPGSEMVLEYTIC